MNGLVRHLARSLAIVVSVGLTQPVGAQITPDRTLPRDSTISRQGMTWVITGGTQRGRNLFHSFRTFSVPRDQRALFEGVDASVNAIFSRITGAAPSRINGTIEVRQMDGSISPASLFLINPNGIIFGPHATLNVGGSFLATTANSVRFADRRQFSAALPHASLLTVSVPIGLQIGTHPGAIVNRSTVPAARLSDGSLSYGLNILPQHTLALVGGNIALLGGGLVAPDGRIALGSLAGQGFVSLTPAPGGWRLGYTDAPTFGSIRLSDQATIDASGATGGTIQVQGGRVRLTQGSRIQSTTLATGRGGSLVIRAAQSVTVDGTTPAGENSQIFTQMAENSRGRAVNLLVDTPQLRVSGGGEIFTATWSASRAGNLTVRARDITLDGIALLPDGQPQLSRTGESFVSGIKSAAFASGGSGTLSITTQRLHLTNAASVQTSSFGEGNAGNVLIQANDAVTVEAQALVDASTNPPLAESIGPSPTDSSRAGNVSIQTDRLTVRDGGRIDVSNSNPNDAAGAGNLHIRAGTVQLDSGTLSATAEASQGGSIHLQVADVLLLRNKSQINSSAGVSRQSGTGGTIAIDAAHGFVVAVPSENSDIWANAFYGRGGRIEIAAQRVFGLETLSLADLQRLLNTTDPKQLFPTKLTSSDIAAISQTSPRLTGRVTFNSPDVDPSRGAIELPSAVSDASRQIARRCRSTSTPAASAFIITGRGGLPPNPTDLHSSETALTDWATLGATSGAKPGTAPDQHQPGRSSSSAPVAQPAAAPTIIEAQGWVIGADGKTELVAQAPTATPSPPIAIVTHCGD